MFFDSLNDSLLSSKRLENAVRHYGAEKISSYATNAAAFTVAIFGGALPAVGLAVPVIAALVSFVNKLEYDYKERDLLETYRDQIAAAKGAKDSKEVNVKDLHDFAEGKGAFQKYGSNPLVRQELANYNREKNIALFTHAISALMFGAIALGTGALAPLYNKIETALSPVISSLGLGAAAMLAYDQIDSCINSLSHTILPTKKTAHDDIKALAESLHKGDSIRPLKVYSIMVHSSPTAQKRVRDTYGMEFDDLYLSQKREMMARDARVLNFGEITRELNLGRLEAEDIVLLIGNNPAMRDPAVDARLKEFHHYRAVTEAAYQGQPAPQGPLMGRKASAINYREDHADRLKTERSRSSDEPPQPVLH